MTSRLITKILVLVMAKRLKQASTLSFVLATLIYFAARVVGIGLWPVGKEVLAGKFVVYSL